ncbi:hypothetical protein [Prevotella lacticifex]|uniref:hypothetical protein n=1 Tax=Prevotella lacticifex TaxID=2854755 RepID=UPI001CC7DD41|nr:hypothetical protein [Prevotella lacticifex]GJG67232.1 hypothetical protein PRLR6025_07010 [Prevotella lacticifex]
MRTKLFLITILGLLCLTANAAVKDSTTFKGRIDNDEYQVYIVMDFYKKNIVCPRQEVFGENPGYFGAKRDTRKWIIEDADVNKNTAKLVIINDYGSEDLDAKLTYNGDGTYTLERLSGSVIKIVVNREWVKIPKKLVFKRKE